MDVSPGLAHCRIWIGEDDTPHYAEPFAFNDLRSAIDQGAEWVIVTALGGEPLHLRMSAITAFKMWTEESTIQSEAHIERLRAFVKENCAGEDDSESWRQSL